MTGSANALARSTVRYLLIVLASVAVACLLLSGLERYLEHRAGGQPASEGIERSIRLREHRPGSVLTMEPDEAFLKEYTQNLAHRKYVVRVDDNGFIIPSRRYDDPDRTVVFLGGSTTECMLVDENLRFPALVGELVSRQTGLKVNSYNGGKGGNNSLHSLNVLLNKVVPLHPDMAIMMHNINDLVILMLEGTYWNNNPKRSAVTSSREQPGPGDVVRATLGKWIPYTMRFIGSLTRRPDTVRGLNMDEFAVKRGTTVIMDHQRFLNEFDMNLRTFIALCRARGITPVLMTQANRFTPAPDPFIKKLMVTIERDYQVPYDEFRKVYDAFNGRIREIGRQQRVTVIDLDRAIPKSGEYLFDYIHYNDAGSELAARVISRSLAPALRGAYPSRPAR